MNFSKITYVLLCCLLLSMSQSRAQSCVWAKRAGGIIEDEAKGVATDAAGNVYVTGYFQSATITFGATTFTNADSTTGDIFIVKYDPSGNVLWAHNAGGPRNDQAMSVATDAAGNVYITGYFMSPTLTFGSTVLTNGTSSALGYDIFLAKYDADGNVVWAKNASGDYGNYATAVAADAAGNAYIAGHFVSTTLTFGSISVNNANPTTADIFIAKYDASGTPVWAKSVGAPEEEKATAVATDRFGNVFVTGYFTGANVAFATTTLINPGVGTTEAFLVRYNADGNESWTRRAGSNGAESGTGLATDSSGNVYMSGYFSSVNVILGSTTLLNNSSTGIAIDMFAAKYDSIGSPVWAKSGGGNSDDYATAIDVGVGGSVYITGYFKSPTVTLGTATLTNTSSGSNDLFVAKYDNTGNLQWATGNGGSKNEYAHTIAADGDGNVLVAGSFTSPTMTIGLNTLTNANGSGFSWDMFVAKYRSSSVSVDDITSQNSLRLYPNPASGSITLSANDLDAISAISIYDMLGRMVYQVSDLAPLRISDKSVELYLPSLANGVYRLCASGRTAIASLPFAIQQ